MDSSSRAFTMTSLECGKVFDFYLIAVNDLGQSEKSSVVTRDLRDASIGWPPTTQELLSINSTRVDIHLSEWKANGCDVTHFRVKNRAFSSKHWLLVSDRVATHSTLSLHGLSSGQWYCLLVSAHNNHRKTEKEYVFSTLTLEGGLSHS